MDEKRYKEIKSRDMEWHLRKKPLTEWKNYSVIQVNLNSGSSGDGEQPFLVSQTRSQQMKCWCGFSLGDCTGGLILRVHPRFPHLSWSMTQPPLKNGGSALPPASAAGSANPARVSVMYFESGRPPWKPERGKLVQVKAESVSQARPALVALSTPWSAKGSAETWCWACDACHSLALCEV